MRLLIELSPDAVFWIGRDARLIYANDYACKMLGYSLDELLKMRVSDFDANFPSETWGKHWDEVERMGRARFETVHRTKDGKSVPVEVTANHIRRNGNTYHFSYARELSERKENERALRTILDNVYDAVFIHEIDGRIVDVNEKMLRMYGVSQEQALRLTIAGDLSAPENPIDLLPALWKSTVGGQSHLLEWKARRPVDGSLFDVEVFLCRIDLRGRTMILANVRDITQRKLAENQRLLLMREQQSRLEAEKANQAKDLFITGLAHELRTPLTAVLAATEALLSGKLDEAARARAIRIIHQSAGTQAYLVNDLLDTSRIALGKLDLSLRDTDLASVARQALESVRSIAEKRSIEIRSRFDPSLPHLAADPIRLQQVFWNLLTNAIKFSPERSTIDFSIAVDSDDFIRIQVADHGKGISPDFLPSIFDHFSQARSASANELTGLGLGLAIARNLVLLHGGTIKVESPGEGKGTTFTIRLPITAGKRA